MKSNKIEVYLTSEELEAKISILADRINKDYAGKKLIVVGLLKGCLFFLTDLVRKLNMDVQIELIYAVSYKGTKSTGNVELLLDLRVDIHEADILVVDDIIDTGLTINKIKTSLLAKQPKSLEFCVLFDKKECRLQDIPVKYIGFTVPNLFYIGYGMDYDGIYRELPFLGVLKTE